VQVKSESFTHDNYAKPFFVTFRAVTGVTSLSFVVEYILKHYT